MTVAPSHVNAADDVPSSATLHAALRAVPVEFSSEEEPAIEVLADGDVPLEQVRARLIQRGFAILRAEPAIVDVAEWLVALGRQLGIGKPYAPAVYAESRSTRPADRVRRLHVTPGEEHPGFGTRDAQGLHTDGTLQAIGTVRTSVLSCVTPAASGGETILFNSVRAFERLADVNPSAFAWLCGPSVLRRSSTLGDGGSHCGPALAIVDGRLVSSYCVDSTDAWEIGSARHARDAVEWLRRASSVDGDLVLTFRLRAGETLVLDNTVVSHGRRAFVDGPGAVRDYYRALFTGSVDEGSAR